MEFSLHQSDLQPGARRVLPYPLTPEACFIAAGTTMPGSLVDFLGGHSTGRIDDSNRWYILVWDRRDNHILAAQATFVWSNEHQQAFCEAMNIEDRFRALYLRPYLMMLGFGLWGVSYDERKHPPFTYDDLFAS